MVSVFVDTGAWFASMVPSDPQHQRILAWLKANLHIQKALTFDGHFAEFGNVEIAP